MSTNINVYISTAEGFDTKYLFPGSYGHAIGDVQQMSSMSWFYRNSAVFRGESEHLQYYAYGGWIATNGLTDLAGAALNWALIDPATGNSSLAYVDIRSVTGSQVAISVPSLASATPDTAIADALSYGDAQIFFHGGTGNDTLRGSFHSDYLRGGDGVDKMVGGAGNDYYEADRGRDKIVEKRDGGFDILITEVSRTLPKHVEGFYANGDRDFRMTGNSLGNLFSGKEGDDTIRGLGGSDTLLGQDGRDVLYGDGGRDHFMFWAAPGKANADIVKDFRHKYDVIEVSQYAHFGLTALVPEDTPLPAHLFQASKSGKAHDADDRILYDKDSGRLYFDSDGNGSAQRALIATFVDDPKITAIDIFIV